jgi:hypothetical protein
MSVPSDIVVPDSMVQIVTDVHILQATLQLGYMQQDSGVTTQKAFESIWKKHHITQADYDHSMKYYTYHPAMLDSIYERVLNNLAQQKAELMGQKHN